MTLLVDGTGVAQAASMRIRFDRGTIEALGGLTDISMSPEWWWDERSQSYRMPASRYWALINSADREGRTVEGDLRARWATQLVDDAPLQLRPYQAAALAAWEAHQRRGVVSLPTGAGKTRVAMAAMALSGCPTAVLCPTRALAHGWGRELSTFFGPSSVGLIGDGQFKVQHHTVLTFESAYRHMDTLGDRFGLLVVDEAHHFATGARIEALESCAAVARLGLTATGPDPNSPGAERLAATIGPEVFGLGYADLVGTHLAPLTVVKIPVQLTPEERTDYETNIRPFEELKRSFLRMYPGADFATTLRAIGQSQQGRELLRARAKALELGAFPKAKRKVVSALLERHREDQTVVFTAFAENAYLASVDNLVPAITGETPSQERAAILDSFQARRIRAIVSARVLNEGIDLPEARVAIIASGVLGAREHIQRIGRVLRPAPHKKALVYELYTANTTDARRARLGRSGVSHRPS